MLGITKFEGRTNQLLKSSPNIGSSPNFGEIEKSMPDCFVQAAMDNHYVSKYGNKDSVVYLCL